MKKLATFLFSVSLGLIACRDHSPRAGKISKPTSSRMIPLVEINRIGPGEDAVQLVFGGASAKGRDEINKTMPGFLEYLKQQQAVIVVYGGTAASEMERELLKQINLTRDKINAKTLFVDMFDMKKSGPFVVASAGQSGNRIEADGKSFDSAAELEKYLRDSGVSEVVIWDSENFPASLAQKMKSVGLHILPSYQDPHFVPTKHKSSGFVLPN